MSRLFFGEKAIQPRITRMARMGKPISKSEARNSKQGSNYKKEEITKTEAVLDFFRFRSFRFVSDFDIRISDFRRKALQKIHPRNPRLNSGIPRNPPRAQSCPSAVCRLRGVYESEFRNR